MAKKYIPQFDWREFPVTLGASESRVILPNDPRRVAVEFVSYDPVNTWISTKAAGGPNNGRIVSSAYPVITYLYKDWGDMVRGEWRATADAAGSTIYVREAFSA